MKKVGIALSNLCCKKKIMDKINMRLFVKQGLIELFLIYSSYYLYIGLRYR